MLPGAGNWKPHVKLKDGRLKSFVTKIIADILRYCIYTLYSCCKYRDAGMGVHDGGTAPWLLKGGETGANEESIMGNFKDARERW